MVSPHYLPAPANNYIYIYIYLADALSQNNESKLALLDQVPRGVTTVLELHDLLPCSKPQAHPPWQQDILVPMQTRGKSLWLSYGQISLSKKPRLRESYRPRTRIPRTRRRHDRNAYVLESRFAHPSRGLFSPCFSIFLSAPFFPFVSPAFKTRYENHYVYQSSGGVLSHWITI